MHIHWLNVTDISSHRYQEVLAAKQTRQYEKALDEHRQVGHVKSDEFPYYITCLICHHSTSTRNLPSSMQNCANRASGRFCAVTNISYSHV